MSRLPRTQGFNRNCWINWALEKLVKWSLEYGPEQVGSGVPCSWHTDSALLSIISLLANALSSVGTQYASFVVESTDLPLANGTFVLGLSSSVLRRTQHYSPCSSLGVWLVTTICSSYCYLYWASRPCLVKVLDDMHWLMCGVCDYMWPVEGSCKPS